MERQHPPEVEVIDPPLAVHRAAPHRDTPVEETADADGWPTSDFVVNPNANSTADTRRPIVLSEALDAPIVRNFEEYVRYLTACGKKPSVEALIPESTRHRVYNLAIVDVGLKRKLEARYEAQAQPWNLLVMRQWVYVL